MILAEEIRQKDGAPISGEAEEVTNVIAFLASDAASYVTGVYIDVDGGMSGAL